MSTYSTEEYKTKRDAYWDAQTAFRQAAIREIERLIPDEASAAVFEMSDDRTLPRVRLAHYIVDGEPAYEDEVEGDFDTIDQIASNMELFNYDEASNILLSHGDGQFIIEKEAGA